MNPHIKPAPPSQGTRFDLDVYKEPIAVSPCTISMSFVTSGPTSFEDNQDRSSFGALQKKLRLWYYQYEVTFSLYMLEPTEKIVLNAFVLSMFSLMLYGVVYFMPEFVIQFVTKGISSLFWVWEGTRCNKSIGSALGL
ncbi:uncharacterized protein L3040_004015 [Drepanopeziza brunnea f. sp. 'multigermtubi']|uniref:uncharacterized protein n=1 Tax=Drepanopeziza brunnea f. sp. 'multigermtubi' TaxID=698441 RepID=UPI0023877467|nr:hypothetical protein L3040_004015 [Drepanopeziza brunnea f. sp. 'multigermtubi']